MRESGVYQELADGDYLNIVADWLEDQESEFAERVRNIALAKPNALMLFTEPESGRLDLSRPWAKDGYIWATDGRIMVRVDASGVPNSPPSDLPRPDVSSLMRQALSNQPEKWSSIQSVSYTEGDARGPCHFCLGYGRTPWHASLVEALPCEYCHDGELDPESRLRIGGLEFSAHFIERIKILAPECEVGAAQWSDQWNKDSGMLHFRAKGVYGLLMPIRSA